MTLKITNGFSLYHTGVNTFLIRDVKYRVQGCYQNYSSALTAFEALAGGGA